MGKKIKTYFGLFLLTAVLFTGCQNNNKESPAEKQPETTPVPTSQESEENKITPTKGASQKLTIEEPVSTEKLVVSLKDGKAWGELPIVGQEDPIYCNLPENTNGFGASDFVKEVVLCPDPLFGMTYYVDFGRDYYIHVIKDGVSELVVEIPAKNLYFREGKLYFMVADYGKYSLDGLVNGDILSYNPVDGKVSVVISGIGEGTIMTVQEKDKKEAAEDNVVMPDTMEVTSTYMAVYQDGIYYSRKGQKVMITDTSYLQPENKYCYSFETGETYLLDESSGDYSFRRNDNGFLFSCWEQTGEEWNLRQSMKSPDGTEETALKLSYYVLYPVNNQIFTTAGLRLENEKDVVVSKLIVYDILTEEENYFPLDRIEDSYTSAMFLFNNTIYFADLYMYSLSEKTGHYAHCNLKDVHHFVGGDFVLEYYTDGEQLYAVSSLDQKIYRLNLHEDYQEIDLGDKSVTFDRKFDFIPINE